jgi:hypothetical protein
MSGAALLICGAGSGLFLRLFLRLLFLRRLLLFSFLMFSLLLSYTAVLATQGLPLGTSL